MLNVIFPGKKITTKTAALALLCAIAFSPAAQAFASDLSDAASLREKCEAESKPLEIAVKNFGSESDKAEFQKGLDMLKTGKVKMAQSKYLDAKAIYNDYLKLQNEVYKSLASSYIAHTEKLIDEVTTELVDFLDNKKVDQYFKLSVQNLNDAKSSVSGERYKTAIDLCRNAKKYALDSYKAVGKALPEKFARDQKDINKELFTPK